VIGIIGGVGSYAGVDVCRKVLESTDASSDQEYLTTHMTLEPNAIEDRTKYLLDKTGILSNPGIAIASQIEKLYSIGARVFGIPCNTAHAMPIFEEAKRALPADAVLVNMIDEVGLFLKEYHPTITRVGVLSSTGTWELGIYPQILNASGIQVVVPDESIQKDFVHPSIYDTHWGIKSRGGPTSRNRDSMKVGIDNMVRDKGAQVIILGCTEFPLALLPDEKISNRLMDVPIIDPTMILARSLVREAAITKLRPYSTTPYFEF